jgi:hypothetical protein
MKKLFDHIDRSYKQESLSWAYCDGRIEREFMVSRNLNRLYIQKISMIALLIQTIIHVAYQAYQLKETTEKPLKDNDETSRS